VSLAPLNLVSAYPWQRVTFTTYALSLSFFEAVILDALIRGGARQALILADVHGVRASLSEQGAQRVGKDYEVEPVAVSSGVFHPKISVFSGTDECHLLVGSGNLTFGGWGGNYEVLEHLHPSFAAEAFADAADFFELLSVTERVHHCAIAHCDATAADLRASIQGKPHNSDIRLFHNLDRPISEQLVELVDSLGGATQMLAAAPFWDQGAAIDGLCLGMGLDRVFIHAHAYGTVEGTAGSNWPSHCHNTVHPVRLEAMDDQDARRLHAKAFEIMCKRGRVLVSGSANGTAAALDRGHNIEACVVRIQRNRTVGWKFVASEPPAPQAALEADSEHEDLSRGILRATLDADDIHGEILTPAMSGVVSVFHVSSVGPEFLAQATLSKDGRFQISAPALEAKSWLGGRLVIRVKDSHARQAEGFVSVASFAEITRRAGIVGRKLLALLAGTETPSDVAAIMSWFYEDPKRLDESAPEGIGGGAKDETSEKPAPVVVVADLAPAAAAAAEAVVAAAGHKGTKSNWSRFMDHIFASFRQKRGPFGRTSAAGKGEDDEDGTDGSESTEPEIDHPAVEKSLAVFEHLFDVLLKPGGSARQGIIAFDLTQYICERLQPEAVQASAWLKRLVEALLKIGVPPERRDDVAAAILSLLGTSSESTDPRWARGCILRLKYDLSGTSPLSGGVRGFQSVLSQSKTFPELWTEVQAIRTYPEQVRSYLDALKNGGHPDQFAELARAANEEWPVLNAALTSKEPFRYILVLDRWHEACPCCNLVLPTGELHKLHSVGIATTKNCCHRVIIWGGG